ncbi:NfeD-like protein [Coleofasciculus sp. LEGE 07092]|nr:NfeD-like protein [Coleofasciculus sp. LEGE 07081]MBE9147247.1 NfeD-like protein [Coleofasciculus sp. LEGE 07092]
MLPIYRFCLIIGGLFVALSALVGLDGADFDQDFDTDLEITDDPDTNRQGEAARRKSRGRGFQLPILSFRFWTFGSCFFGLTGVVLSILRPTMPQFIVAAISVAMGVLCGTSMVGVLRSLRGRQADSLVRPRDVIGLLGTVEIPFDRTNRGKVRVSVKDSVVDFIALTEHPQGFDRGARVLVVEMQRNKVWVVPEDSLSQ